MGRMLKITCRSCGVGWECRTGCGMQHGNLGTVAGLYPEDIRKEIMEHAAGMEFPVYDFGYRPAHCRQCRAIVGIPVLSFGYGGTEYAGVCDRCGQAAEPAEDIAQILCPACHEAALEKEDIGLWD